MLKILQNHTKKYCTVQLLLFHLPFFLAPLQRNRTERMEAERALEMQVSAEQGEDVAECTPPLIQRASSKPPAPPPQSPWYRRCRAKLFLSFTSTVTLLAALLYFAAESKVIVAAFDATLKQLIGNVGNFTFDSLKQNLTEALTTAVRSASFANYAVASGQPDDG